MNRAIDNWGIVLLMLCLLLAGLAFKGRNVAHAPTMKADTIYRKSFIDSIREDNKGWYDRRKRRIIKDYDTDN